MLKAKCSSKSPFLSLSSAPVPVRQFFSILALKASLVMYLVFNGHCPTDAGVRSGETVMQRPWPLVKANSFVLVSEPILKAINYMKGPKPNLGH